MTGAKVHSPRHIVDPIGKASAISAMIEDDGSTLPEALRALERRLTREQPERVVLVDASDTALAAALVATKLGIAVEARPEASDGSTTNGVLIGQLAVAYTEPA